MVMAEKIVIVIVVLDIKYVMYVQSKLVITNHIISHVKVFVIPVPRTRFSQPCSLAYLLKPIKTPRHDPSFFF